MCLPNCIWMLAWTVRLSALMGTLNSRLQSVAPRILGYRRGSIASCIRAGARTSRGALLFWKIALIEAGSRHDGGEDHEDHARRSVPSGDDCGWAADSIRRYRSERRPSESPDPRSSPEAPGGRPTATGHPALQASRAGTI